MEQAKLEDNRLVGTIPAELASLPRLKVLWLEKNDLRGSIPTAFGAPDAFGGSLVSFNVEDNPKLCGPAPPGLEVDWSSQLTRDAIEGASRDWFAFCEKDPCGVFATGGTKVGTPVRRRRRRRRRRRPRLKAAGKSGTSAAGPSRCSRTPTARSATTWATTSSRGTSRSRARRAAAAG